MRRLAPREIAIALGAATVWALVVRPGPLSLPYFWDEADVYAPGAKWLADHDLDPTPGHFPDDWSRGHPPLLYVVAALAFRLLGPGPAIGHALIVPFTALALALTYALAAERAGRVAGVIAAVALACSPLFMTMGAFLLPEMPMTALTVLALWCCSRRAWMGAAACGVALVWTKETGVGVPIAIACGVAAEAWRSGRLRDEGRAIAISLAPVLALIAFFAWQRATAGYFVFPHHAGLLDARPFGIENLVTVFPSVLAWHGRIALVIVALLCAIGLARARAWPAALAPDATTIAIVVLFLGNALFFAKMFWLERYALPVHPGVAVLIGCAIASYLQRVPRLRWPVAIAVAAAGALGLASLRAPSSAPEHTFAFAAHVERDRDAIQRIAGEGDPLVITTWPLTTELREPWLGYAPRPLRSLHPDHVGPEHTIDRVLIDHGSRRREPLRELARARGMRERWAIERDGAPRLELWGP